MLDTLGTAILAAGTPAASGLVFRRYWRPERRPHPGSFLVDPKISAIRLFNSCSVINLPALYGPGDRVDPVPGATLFRVVFPPGFLTAFVQ